MALYAVTELLRVSKSLLGYTYTVSTNLSVSVQLQTSFHSSGAFVTRSVGIELSNLTSEWGCRLTGPQDTA